MARTKRKKLAAFLSVGVFCISTTLATTQDSLLRLSRVQRASSQALVRIVDSSVARRSPSLLTELSDRHYSAPLRGTDPATMPSSPADQISLSACRADAVVVGHLSSPRGFLSENTRFILTQYELNVSESLDGPLGVGDVVDYIRPGGKLMINGRTIEVSTEEYPELEEGAPYLLFLRRVPGEENAFTVFVGDEDRWAVDVISLSENSAKGVRGRSIAGLRAGIDAREARTAARCAQ